MSTGQAGAAGNARFGDAFDALLASARHGDAWAWRQLWDWLAPAVAGYCWVQGARDVDDLVSETFLGVVKGIARFEGSEAQLRSWVFVIAHGFSDFAVVHGTAYKYMVLWLDADGKALAHSNRIAVTP